MTNKEYVTTISWLVGYSFIATLGLIIITLLSIHQTDQQLQQIIELKETDSINIMIIDHLKATIQEHHLIISLPDSTSITNQAVSQKGVQPIHTNDIKEGVSRGGSGL